MSKQETGGRKQECALPFAIFPPRGFLAPRTAAIIASPVNRRRLTGFESSDGLLFLTPGAARAVAARLPKV